MKYEDWPYHPSRLPTHIPDLETKLRELQEVFLAELKADPRVAEYLKSYDPKWAAKFLDDYAMSKVNAVRYSKYHIEALEEIETGRELRYRKQTEEVFDMILQKKLFNLQCLWRAEQITLPGVRSTWDFLYWGRNIRSCTFIEPVTMEEVELMRQFLRSDDYTDQTDQWLVEWQDYERIREPNEEGEYDLLPEWYEYYDEHMGTGALMQLPDIRSPKEEHYRKLWREEQASIRESEGETKPKSTYVPPPPAIHCSIEERYKFAQVVDDPVFQRIFLHDIMDAEERSEAEEGDEGEDPAEIIMMHLENIKNPPPVRGGLSWREAIRQCWKDYLNNVIAEDLDLVWNEYRMYLETGLIPVAEDDLNYKSLGDEIAVQILRGRVLAGEPEDFNY